MCASILWYVPTALRSFESRILTSRRLNNVQISITGCALTTDSAVVVCNHRSLADYFMVAFLARYAQISDSAHRLPRVNFFSWFLIWRVPGGRLLRHMYRCDENWELEPDYAAAEMSKLAGSPSPEWIAIFPEVNVWTADSSTMQKRMAQRYCLPTLENLLYPRYSAMYNIISGLSALEEHPFHTLYDVSISYRVDGQTEHTPCPISPTLLDVLCSDFRISVLIHVEQKRIDKIPTRRSKLERYLERMWIFKDSAVRELDIQSLEFEEGNVAQPQLFHEILTPLLRSSQTATSLE